MSTQTKIRFLQSCGVGEMEHDSYVPFLSHLVGTSELLRQWGARGALCDAGLFHSVYGTEFFTPDETFGFPPRAEVQELIGAEAEEIAWLWCVIARTSLDPDTYAVTHRGDQARMTISADRVRDIATLWAADIVEQLARMAPDEQRFARGASRLSAHMLPAARAALGEALGSTSCEA